MILMQKTTADAPVKDSLESFGVVCTDFPFRIGGETKDLPSRDWPDEDGEDTYIPARLPLKAYDIEVGFCYTGGLGLAASNLTAFRNYLTGADGSGAEMKIYNSHTKIGRTGVYLLELDDEAEFHVSGSEEVLTFKAKFKVTNPTDDVVPSFDTSDPQKVVSLAVQ